MPEEKSFSKKRPVMYVIGFFFNLSSAIPTYVNSSFLAKFTGNGLVGIIYTASSILALAAFIEMSGILRRFGNFKTTMGLLFIEMLSLAGLAFGNNTIAIISSFLLNFVIIALINFTLDVFLEEFSNDRHTGKIRGTFLTIENTAWLIAPLLASWILQDSLYSHIYMVSGLLLIPVTLIVFGGLHTVKDPQFQRISFWKSFGAVWAQRDVKSILLVQFFLQFFYAWMVIYTPIYLHQVVGFDWSTIGIIFTVMLTPFVLIEIPLGKLADKIGEKKALALGFIIMGFATGSIAFVTDHNPYIWAAILFMTRVGAATVEVMSDAYFFKHVEAANTQTISFSRMMRPLAYVIGPVVATILFLALDMKGLFIFLGFLMFYAIRSVIVLKDTRTIA
jgi:MFS family permease